MKILITGAGGFLGKRIVERLLAHGLTDLRCMLRDTTKGAALTALAANYPQAKLELVAANLRNQRELPPVLTGVDLVIHAAAALKGSPAEMFLDSVVAARNLLDAIAEMPSLPRIVLISSFGVIGVPSMPRGAMVDESSPMETNPGQRDIYSYTKLRQEQMFRDYQQRLGFELVVLRPGVIYGPGSGHFSNRVGLSMFGRFLHLGGSNLLPLTYVDNCAEAIVVAALSPQAAGHVYNVVDDQLLTSAQYLSQYRQQVKRISTLRIPYWLLLWGSKFVAWYAERSRGQLPAIFTPYKTKAMWGGNQFSNARLKALGWAPIVSTPEALQRSFTAFRAEAATAK